MIDATGNEGKFAREVAYSLGSVESPPYLRIRISEDTPLDVVNLFFLKMFQHLSCLICTEELNTEIDHDASRHQSLGGIYKAAEHKDQIVSLVWKSGNQNYPLPAMVFFIRY